MSVWEFPSRLQGIFPCHPFWAILEFQENLHSLSPRGAADARSCHLEQGNKRRLGQEKTWTLIYKVPRLEYSFGRTFVRQTVPKGWEAQFQATGSAWSFKLAITPRSNRRVHQQQSCKVELCFLGTLKGLFFEVLEARVGGLAS